MRQTTRYQLQAHDLLGIKECAEAVKQRYHKQLQRLSDTMTQLTRRDKATWRRLDMVERDVERMKRDVRNTAKVQVRDL